MQKFIMKIKRINKKNYVNFYNQFSKIKDFKVSKKILFYEINEIKYWIENPKLNLFYGVFEKNKCLGFCFCKIMSNHWALIDNFYISPEYRGNKLGVKLQKFIEIKLKNKNIKYISRVTRNNNRSMKKFLTKNNYKKTGQYTWFEKFL